MDKDDYKPPKHFGEFVQRVRTARKIRLSAFCRAAGIEPSYWSKIERGLLPHHSLQIPEIANALDVSDDVLLAAEASCRAHHAASCSIWALEELLAER